MGLKDQLLALEWVNQNIGAFGGDKYRIFLATVQVPFQCHRIEEILI